MSKKKIVYELAKEMGISNKELIDRLEVVGVSGKKSVSGLTDEQVMMVAAARAEEPLAVDAVEEDEPVEPTGAEIPSASLRDLFPEANKVYVLVDGIEQYLPVSQTTTKDEVWQVYESFRDGVLQLPDGGVIKCTSVILGTHSALARNQTVFPETLKQYDPE